MDDQAIIDEAALPELLRLFYGRVRQDEALGPVFNDAVHDWDEHLDRLADFWSSVMLTTRRYKGNPVAKHLAHAGRITPELFERWLSLWAQATSEVLPAAAAHAMQMKAARIAESLQLALQFPTPAQRALHSQPAHCPLHAARPYRKRCCAVTLLRAA